MCSKKLRKEIGIELGDSMSAQELMWALGIDSCIEDLVADLSIDNKDWAFSTTLIEDEFLNYWFTWEGKSLTKDTIIKIVEIEEG